MLLVGELVKFNMFAKSEALHCLKVLAVMLLIVTYLNHGMVM